MTRHSTITKGPDTPETLDFQALLRAGIEAAQAFSGAEWTDYNAHDPGVTILETLVFALTDIAYRTGHPMADILASSAQSTRTTPDRLALYPGPQAFTTAPVTADDFRKLLYDQVEGLRNAWILPAGPGPVPAGLVDAWLQPFAPEDPTDRDGIARTRDRIEAEARALLSRERGLGMDFRHVRVVPTRTIALQAELTLAPEADPDAALAALLLAVETALTPPPEVADLDAALAAGGAPEELFDGPALEVGLIPDTSLRPARATLDLAAVRAAILALPEIRAATGIAAIPVSEARDVVTLSIPELSRHPEDLAGLRVFRRGARLTLDPAQVLLQLRHREETLRWDERYAIRRTARIPHASVPMGNPDRGLARYRSIQHMFPGIYGIGPDGVADDTVLSLAEMTDGTARTRRMARARQLKGYLVVFEQMLTDHLAQLNATADLLSLPPDMGQDGDGTSGCDPCEDPDPRPDRPTYATQPLTRPQPTQDDAPDLAPVLGGPDTPGPGTDTAWHDRHVAGLEAVRDRVDRPLERRNRALDHLLARFGETLDSAALKRLYDDRTRPRATFERWLLRRKAEMLRDVVDLGGGRGRGLDLAAPEACALTRRIRLRSGHDGAVHLIEHILLRDDGLEAGIGAAEIGANFAISPALPRTALRLRLDAQPVHWVLSNPEDVARGATLTARLRDLGADPAHYTRHPRPGYGAAVRIDNGAGLAVDVVENFSSASRAQDWIDRMVTACRAPPETGPGVAPLLEPVLMPLDFAARGASLIVAPCPDGTTEARRAYLADIAAQELPAHVLTAPLWLDPTDVDTFAAAVAGWRQAQLCLRRTALPSDRTREEATRGSQVLRRWIHQLFCRTLTELRDRDRRSGAPS